MSPRPDTPLVIEPFTPVSRSLEFRIGAAYWRRQGSAAFRSGAVPHLGTTDGMLAARAADVLYQSCLEASGRGELEDEVQVVELGAGLGLFARLFLNRLQQRCQATGSDFYDRVRYVATDQSPKMVSDLAGSGTLDEHGSHVHFGLVDALHPGELIDPADGSKAELGGLRAMVHTYVLDTLPFEYIVDAGAGWLRMHAMTLVDKVSALCQRTGLDRAELSALMAGDTDKAIEVLLPVQDLLSLEWAYFPVDRDDIPYGDCLAGVAARVRAEEPGFVRVTWPVGAMDSVIASLGSLRPDGFLLCADYGRERIEADFSTHQRYGGSRARGVNFAGMEYVLGQQNRDRAAHVRVVKAPGDERAKIHARLFMAADAPAVEEVFRQRFDQADFDAISELREKARAAALGGDREQAAAMYVQAGALAPENWLLKTEWADFETNLNGNPEHGLELAEEAFEMNPTCHAVVLTALGDAFGAVGRLSDSLEAYKRASAIQPDDVRSRIGIAVCYAEMGHFIDACFQFGGAFGVDVEDANRSKLLAGLNAVLDRRVATRKAGGG